MTLDWKSIRPLNGGREKGFEELCAQLARAEAPAGSKFVRKGIPDAGVECYAILSDGAEWGWQSKYVFRFGDSQWSQLDASVKTALAKHPRLVRYFVCVPVDRADARISGRKSAQERWDHHVVKWTGWARDRGTSVDFVYWGSHELLQLLAEAAHIGRVRFWFDVRGFDAPWFTARLDEAILSAGPRYTPEIHVDLPIVSEFEAFGRTDHFFDGAKATARDIRKALRATQYSKTRTDPTIDAKSAAVSEKVGTVLAAIGAIEGHPAVALPFNAILEQVGDALEAAEEFSQLLLEQLAAKPESTAGEASRPPYRSDPLRDREIRLRRLISELERVRQSFVHANEMAGSRLLIVRGAAGTGKTHLLCDLARQRLTAGRPTVLLMGQRFLSNDAPWSQALQQLDLSGLSIEEFLGALESSAEAAGARALFVIDAINEGTGRDIWPNHLGAFVAHLNRSPWIGVVLAVRSSFEDVVVPADVRSRAAVVTHSGFAGHEYDATKTFFLHYDLVSRP